MQMNLTKWDEGYEREALALQNTPGVQDEM